MPEYELLELVLFNAVPRIDVKPLAKTLLAAFGDLNGVIAAPEPRLMQVPGVDAAGASPAQAASRPSRIAWRAPRSCSAR